MGENSKIEWTDHTWNPWIGCTKVAAGCQHCYAEELMDHRYGKVKWGPNGTRVITSPSNWAKPLKWNRDAERAGVRARVFCASLADVFESWGKQITTHDGRIVGVCSRCHKFNTIMHRSEWDAGEPEWFCRLADGGCGEQQHLRAATMKDVRRELFALIDATPNLDWLLLTKRPENIQRMWELPALHPGAIGSYRKNVWIGTSVAVQADADANIPELLKCRDLSPVLFLSMEPLLGPVHLDVALSTGDRFVDKHLGWLDVLDWVIVGGESGHKSRYCDIAWIRRIVAQCRRANVPVFVKQLGARLAVPNDSAGEWPKEGDEWIEENPDYRPRYQGEPIILRMNDKGGNIDEWPADLRVRKFPIVKASTP